MYFGLNRGSALCYLFDSLEKSWQFPGRDGKAVVCALCPQKSGKEHCSLGEALNLAVFSAVLASWSGNEKIKPFFFLIVTTVLK